VFIVHLFMTALVVELRALGLLGRYSAASATAPAVLALAVFEIGFCFMSG
jgi:hypothetical protein